jgi:hypothetical protein
MTCSRPPYYSYSLVAHILSLKSQPVCVPTRTKGGMGRLTQRKACSAVTRNGLRKRVTTGLRRVTTGVQG